MRWSLAVFLSIFLYGCGPQYYQELPVQQSVVHPHPNPQQLPPPEVPPDPLVGVAVGLAGAAVLTGFEAGLDALIGDIVF